MIARTTATTTVCSGASRLDTQLTHSLTPNVVNSSACARAICAFMLPLDGPSTWHPLPRNSASESDRNHYNPYACLEYVKMLSILVYYYQITTGMNDEKKKRKKPAIAATTSFLVGAVGVHSCGLGVSHAVRQQKMVKSKRREENRIQVPQTPTHAYNNKLSIKKRRSSFM